LVLLLVCALCASAMQFIEFEVVPMRMARASDDDSMSRIAHNDNFRRMLVSAMKRMEQQMAHDLEEMQEEAEEALEERQPQRRRRGRGVAPAPSAPRRRLSVMGQATLVSSQPGRLVYDVCFRPLQFPSARQNSFFGVDLTMTQATPAVAVQDVNSGTAPVSLATAAATNHRGAFVRVLPTGSFVLRVFSAVALQQAQLWLESSTFAAFSPQPCHLPGTAGLATAGPVHPVHPPAVHPTPMTTVPAPPHAGRPFAALMFGPPLLLLSLVLLLLLILLRCCCAHRRCPRQAAAAAPAAPATPGPAQYTAVPSAPHSHVFSKPPPAVPLYAMPPQGYAMPVAHHHQGPSTLSVYPQRY